MCHRPSPPRHRSHVSIETPHYTHDCDNCTFLGNNGRADLYYCTQSGTRVTLIARYSSEGSDYISGLGVGHRDLDSARIRAMDRGLALTDPSTEPATTFRDRLHEDLSVTTDPTEIRLLIEEAINFGRDQARDEFGWDALSILGGPHSDPKALLASRDATTRVALAESLDIDELAEVIHEGDWMLRADEWRWSKASPGEKNRSREKARKVVAHLKRAIS